MEINYEELEFNKDFFVEKAEELGLFQLNLELPEGLEVIGFTRNNRILLRRQKIKGEKE